MSVPSPLWVCSLTTSRNPPTLKTSVLGAGFDAMSTLGTREPLVDAFWNCVVPPIDSGPPQPLIEALAEISSAENPIALRIARLTFSRSEEAATAGLLGKSDEACVATTPVSTTVPSRGTKTDAEATPLVDRYAGGAVPDAAAKGPA